MKLVRRILILSILVCGGAFLTSTHAVWATTRYIAQTPGTFSGGSACNSQTAITPSTFNSTTLTPGDVAYICGTITAPAGSSDFIKINQSGTSANPISLIFDTNAVLTATYWGGNAINIFGNSYITINGGTNGTIQATANGTTLANQQETGQCISNGGPYSTPTTNSTDVTIENIICSNMYVDSSTSDESGQSTGGFSMANVNNLTITHNTIHDTKWAISLAQFEGTSVSNETVSYNNIYNIDHGLYVGADEPTGGVTVTGLYFYGNTLGSMVNWDDVANNNHHDEIHIFTENSATRYGNFYFYNNKVVGDPGANGNAGFQIEAQASGVTGTVANYYVFNNVFSDTSTTNCYADGVISSYEGGGTVLWANNTVLTASCGNAMNWSSGSTGLTAYNNIVQGGTGVYTTSGTSVTAVNYQDYYQATWYWDGSEYTTLPNWQKASGQDANSITSNPSLTNYVPASTSPVVGAGINIYSTCSGQPNPGLGALCSDAAGNVRPATGAWDEGAFSHGSGVVPGAPTNLAGSVVAK